MTTINRSRQLKGGALASPELNSCFDINVITRPAVRTHHDDHCTSAENQHTISGNRRPALTPVSQVFWSEAFCG